MTHHHQHRRIGVIGATGVLGRAVIPRLLARGHTVHALARKPAAGILPAHPNLHIFEADILQPQTLPRGLEGCSAALHLATAIPRPGGPPDWTLNNAVRDAGTKAFLAACAAAGVVRYVQQSIVMLYDDGADAWLTEGAPFRLNPVNSSAAVMENAVVGSGLQWVILRGGVFYGPGTSRAQEWNALAKAGTLTLPGEGLAYLSLIHVDDMADAVAAATDSNARELAFNIVDDQPVTFRDLFEFIAGRYGAAKPAAGGPPLFPSLRVSNRLARETLGWRPAHPSYRSGWID